MSKAEQIKKAAAKRLSDQFEAAWKKKHPKAKNKHGEKR